LQAGSSANDCLSGRTIVQSNRQQAAGSRQKRVNTEEAHGRCESAERSARRGLKRISQAMIRVGARVVQVGELPAPAIEGLAAALTPVRLPAGGVLIQEGDQGDAYYAVASGELDARQDGQFLRRVGRGEGVGEIALLRAIPRTASVIAHTDATVYELNRDLFLTAVVGHAATQRRADHIADTRLATGAAPDGDGAAGTAGTAAAEPG
jgi:CRP-like cAMP-binding protein